jgi:hypothetical protein
MAFTRWLTVGLLFLAGTGEASAQIILSPYGYGGRARFKHHRHRWRASGYLGVTGSGFLFGPYSPFGVTVTQVQIIVPASPTIIVNAGPRGRPEPDDEDMSPIDLDTTDPVTMRPRKPPPEEGEPVEAPRRPREVERPRLPPPPELPGPPPPRERPGDNVTDPVERGKRAFANREYGLAAQCFRQAALADPAAAMPQFLLAQAQFALGKYRDAFHAIRAGMDRKRDWPTTRFPPRALYEGNDVEFLGHLKRLEDLIEKHANDPVLLFVLAYELWFDGQREKARGILQKVNKILPDPSYADRFLRVPG